MRCGRNNLVHLLGGVLAVVCLLGLLPSRLQAGCHHPNEVPAALNGPSAARLGKLSWEASREASPDALLKSHFSTRTPQRPACFRCNQGERELPARVSAQRIPLQAMLVRPALMAPANWSHVSAQPDSAYWLDWAVEDDEPPRTN